MIELHVFYKKIFYKKMSLKNSKTFRKCYKSPASDAYAAIFKNTYFSYSSSKFTKLSKVSYLNSFCLLYWENDVYY